MKTMIMMLMLAPFLVAAQQFSDKVTKTISFEKKTADNAIMIANINGSVTVTGYDGSEILLEATRSISAKTDSRLAKAKEEISLGTIDRADTIILYVKDGCSTFGKKSKGRVRNGWFKNGYGYMWEDETDCKHGYDYKMDFTIKVPAGVNVLVSTINDGDIVVQNVKGAIQADNINGSIKLTNLVREADASTINGDVDIEYAKNPGRDCRFYSLNGDINAWFQKGLAATLSFESFNGEFYTNIDKLEALPVKVEKTASGQGVKYKINGNNYQIGQGGVFLDFETFNGNVYLKERTN